jgi:type IV secretory pathway VirB6-like protein
MLRSFFTKFLQLFISCFAAACLFFISCNSYALYEGVRDGITYDDSTYRCDTGTIAFDPFSSNKDVNWELTNPVCIAFSAGVGATMLAAYYAASYLCTAPIALNAEAQAQGPEEEIEDVTPPATSTLIPSTLVKTAQKIKQCASRTAEFATYVATGNGAEASLASSDMIKCCTAVTAYSTAVGLATSAMAVTWNVAKITYENARICGHDWQQWQKDDSGIWKFTKGPYRNCVEDLFLENGIVDSSCSNYGINSDSSRVGDSQAVITNQFYREFIYGGKEFEDSGNNSCDNPSSWSSDDKLTKLGYDSGKQRYYMTGAGVAPVYACYRFLTTNQTADVEEAYECCKRRSQNAVCIESRTGLGDILSDYNYAFCEIGSRCSINNVIFEAYASTTKPNYVCARTYSVCPYNHLLAGGTEKQEADSSNLTLVKNFCQFMNHCSKIPVLPYVNSSNLTGAFISSACKDMKGDAQNVYGYTSQLIPINTRNFSAPMAQCFKETMENVFLNKAGDTICLDSSETVAADGTCTSGYAYKKGDYLTTESFFIKVQNSLQTVIKLTLTMSVMFFGFMILYGGSPIAKKQLLPYILKIALVMYFAVGDAWQFGFMNGLTGTSSLLSQIMFRVDESGDDSTLDGCQFPRYNYADSNESTKYDEYITTTDASGNTVVSANRSYPPGEEYLQIWDTLDCKIAFALGFGPEVSVPNLIFMILGGFLTGGLGIIFVLASFSLAFFLIALTVRALHIFLLSITSVIILMYISPILIPMVMFQRTKYIFESWWKQILGFTLQPMILFAYLGILVTLFDKVIIGSDVTFTGDGRQSPKQIVCNDTAEDTSIYCIFRISDIKTFTGLEVLGIGLPILGSMNQDKLQTIIKAALIMFVFMKFMDQISLFAYHLVGGSMLESGWKISAAGMAKNAYKTLRGIQERGMNVIKKQGGFIARKAGQELQGIGRALGDRGRAVGPATDITGGDRTDGGLQGQNRAGQGTSGQNQTGQNLSGQSQTAAPSAPPLPTGASAASGAGNVDPSAPPLPTGASGAANVDPSAPPPPLSLGPSGSSGPSAPPLP